MAEELDDLFSESLDERMKMVQQLFNKTNIEMKTELTRGEIQDIVQAETLAKFLKEKWDIDTFITDITTAFKTHMVSHQRKGRSEAVEILRGRNEEDDKKDKNRIRKMLGI